MPDGYEYTDISQTDFLAALEVYLGRLQREAKANTPAWEKIARTLAPSGLTGIESINERFDRIYNEILDAVDIYGLSPAVTQGLSPEAGQIFSTTLQKRASYEWDKQYKGDLDKWATDVVAAQAKYASEFDVYTKSLESKRRWEAEFGATQQWRQYGAEMEQWKFGQQQRIQAQEQMWERERTQQETLAAKYNWQASRFVLRGRSEATEREAMSRAWESAQAERVAGERNWIERYAIQQKENPWKQQRTVDEEIRATKEEIKGLREANRIIQQRQKDPTDPMFINVDRPDMPTTPEQGYAREIMSRLKTAEDKLIEWTTSPDYVTGRAEARGEVASPTVARAARPTTPKTPAWLAAIEPELGERVEKRKPAPLTTQAWMGLTPQQQEKWAGWVEWSGYSPQQMFGQGRQQERRGTRWAPARQQVSI